MQKIASIFFVFLLVVQVSSKLGVEVWFYYNQAALVEQFCENKAKPEMQCNGKCYLKKQLDKLEVVEGNTDSNNQKEKQPSNSQLKVDFVEQFAAFQVLDKRYFERVFQFDSRYLRLECVPKEVIAPPPKFC